MFMMVLAAIRLRATVLIALECCSILTSLQLFLCLILQRRSDRLLPSEGMFVTITTFAILIGVFRATTLASWAGLLRWPPMDSLRILFIISGFYLEALWVIVQIALYFTEKRHFLVFVCQVLRVVKFADQSTVQ
jgi:hypothetical protein